VLLMSSDSSASIQRSRRVKSPYSMKILDQRGSRHLPDDILPADDPVRRGQRDWARSMPHAIRLAPTELQLRLAATKLSGKAVIRSCSVCHRPPQPAGCEAEHGFGGPISASASL
jgi:hypothetical protein